MEVNIIKLLEILKDSIPSLLVFISTLITGWWLHKREMNKGIKIVKKAKQIAEVSSKKSEYIPRIMALPNVISLTKAVNEIFEKTRATRFLILIGVNGKYDMNTVSCLWYHYKDTRNDFDPTYMYSNVDISEDSFYKSMLSKLAKYPNIHQSVETMGMPQSILKDIYKDEEIVFSKVGFLTRAPIDGENDMVSFFSCSTDEDVEGGFTQHESNIIKLIINSQIKPSMEELQGL